MAMMEVTFTEPQMSMWHLRIGIGFFVSVVQHFPAFPRGLQGNEIKARNCTAYTSPCLYKVLGRVGM
jgi:hypothetical protein